MVAATDPVPPHATDLVDVLDRVLDKGVVIDAYVRIAVVGIDLVTVSARVVAASIETYMQYAEVLDELKLSTPVARAIRIRRNGSPTRGD